MFARIDTPAKGTPLRASWAAGVAGRLNELCGGGSAGMLMREGMTGNFATPLPANKRMRRIAATQLPWDVKFVPDPEPESSGGVYCFYLPEGSFIYNGKNINPPDMELDKYDQDKMPDWWCYPFEITTPDTKIFLVGWRQKKDDKDLTWSICLEEDADEDDERNEIILLVAIVDGLGGTDEEGNDVCTGGTVKQQLLSGALVLNDKGSDAGKDRGRFSVEVTTKKAESSEDEDAKISTAKFSNCYVRVGGKTYEVSLGQQTVQSGILCITVDTKDTEPVFKSEWVSDLSTLQEKEGDMDMYYLPLYTFKDDGTIACDWRTGIDMVMGEF